MIKKLLIAFAALALSVGFVRVASAHDSNVLNCHGNDRQSDTWQEDNCVNVCHLNDNGKYVVLTENKDQVQPGDFTYGGPVNKNGKPNSDAAAWCVENQPKYSCDSLDVKSLGTREIGVTANVTATNGAIVSGTTFDFGDGTTPDSGTALTDQHTYSADGSYTLKATIDFNVNGLDKTDSCSTDLAITTTTLTVNHTVVQQDTDPTPTAAPTFEGK